MGGKREKKSKEKLKEFKPIRPLPAGHGLAPAGSVPPIVAARFRKVKGQLPLPFGSGIEQPSSTG